MMFRVLVTLNEELLRLNGSQSQIFRILFTDQLIIRNRYGSISSNFLAVRAEVSASTTNFDHLYFAFSVRAIFSFIAMAT